MKNACPKCHHQPEEDVEHVCPSPEYLAWHRKMVGEAAKHDDLYRDTPDYEPFMVTIPRSVFDEIKTPAC